jgi:hypothetical protein
MTMNIQYLFIFSGISINTYCYSEAQAGKSYCDAKIAHLRQKMSTHVSDGNDIVTANDMKLAIDCGSGVAGCQAAVVTIDTTHQISLTNKWKGVTSINNIVLHANHHTTQFKAYAIGEGEKVNTKTLSSKEPTPLGLVLLDDFKKPKSTTGMIKNPVKITGPVTHTITETDHPVGVEESDHATATAGKHLFVCPEIGCVKSYKLYSAFQQHVFFGKHSYIKSSSSTFDSIKRKWAENCNNLTAVTRAQGVGNCNLETRSSRVLLMGWALRQQRKNARFENTVRDFLRKIFHEGEITGKKANPHDVARKMKTTVDDKGKRTFKPSDCLQPTQISSYFSRLSLLNKKVTPSKTKTETADELSDGQLNAILTEIEVSKVREMFV